MSGNVHGLIGSLIHQTSSSGLFDIMQIAVDRPLLDRANSLGFELAATVEDSGMYDALARVKPDDLSWNQWAVKAGVGRSIFTEIRRHGNPTRETLRKLLSVIDIDLELFTASRAPVETEVRSAGIGDVRSAQYGSSPLPKLRLLGSAIGGEFDQGGVDLIELQLGEVLDHLMRPASLADDSKAYALTVISDSMSPRFEPGERIAVSPKAPVQINDDVIVQLRAEGNGEGDQTSDRIVQVLVKRLVRRSATYIELRQFNPDNTFKVPAERIAHIQKVVGRLF